MAKKIVQLENKDGDQIFPISATDIALPGTKVKTEFRTSGGDIAARTDTVLVTETIATPGDYAVIGSVDVQMGSSNRIDVHLYHNGSTSLAQQYTTPISNRAGLTLIGRLDNASEGDTVSLNVRCDDSATTDSRTQGLALIKLPTGAPTYKGGALVVTLNAGGTYSGATTTEMYNAIRNGKPVVLRGPILDSGSALLLSMNFGVRTSWGMFVNQDSGILYRLVFNDDNDTWSVQAMTGDSYYTSEVKTGDTWVDGKPIYKKTVTKSSTGGTTITHGISNFGTLVKIEGSAYDSTSRKYIALPSAVTGASSIGIWTVSTTEVVCTSTVNDPFTWNVTLYYTKTTD